MSVRRECFPLIDEYAEIIMAEQHRLTHITRAETIYIGFIDLLERRRKERGEKNGLDNSDTP